VRFKEVIMIGARQSSIITRWSTIIVFIIGALSIISCLVQGGCNQHAWYKPFLTSNENSLFKAAAKGDTSEVKRLLDQGTNIDAREEENETPLMYAAAEGRSEVVSILIDRGASINAVSDNGETALARAVGRSQYETVNLLLNRGADVEKRTDRNGTPLMAAAGEGDVKMIEMLLKRGANVNASDDDGYTPLTVAVTRRASAAAVRLLISAGADVNKPNRQN